MRWVFKFLFKIILALVFFYTFLFLQPAPAGFSENIKLGVTFSKNFANDLTSSWWETYIAILDDLKVKYLRLPVYWEDVEPQQDNYFFDDYDWMIKEAEKRNVKLILVVGEKLPRWPECHNPEWVNSQDSRLKTQYLLDYVKKVVERYKDSPSLYLWQVENEPFLPFTFGECPNYDNKVLDKEIELVRSLDSEHKILITDSGELGFWLKAAGKGDIFGTTIYRVVWDKYIGYIKYNSILPKQFYWLKANLIHLFYPDKKIIVSELQDEPWAEGEMDLKQFQSNAEFVKKVGFSEAYLWGVEWWYWMKQQQNDPSFWEEAKKVIGNL